MNSPERFTYALLLSAIFVFACQVGRGCDADQERTKRYARCVESTHQSDRCAAALKEKMFYGL